MRIFPPKGEERCLGKDKIEFAEKKDSALFFGQQHKFVGDNKIFPLCTPPTL